MTQKELAALVGVTLQAVRKMESDAGGVSAVNAFAVADALQVSARWLVTGVDAAGEPPKVPPSSSASRCTWPHCQRIAWTPWRR
ncbi:hypothetical protein WDL1P1_00516 (plasmid) [Variovorax sp. WDL1]|nr:hypothetical protein WDL1P1_00516 [Variovorax sp. WDL1]